MESEDMTGKVKGHVIGLLDAYQDLLSLKVVEHASRGISISIVGVLTLLTAAFVLLFAGLGSAWWIGERIENMKVGFFIVGGLYAFILLILILLRKTVLPHIRNFVIKKIYEQH